MIIYLLGGAVLLVGGFMLYKRGYFANLFPPMGGPPAPMPDMAPPVPDLPDTQPPPTYYIYQIQQIPDYILVQAYDRIAQYVLYFKSGKRHNFDDHDRAIIRQKIMIIIQKARRGELHGEFADRFLEVANKIRQGRPALEIEQSAKTSARSFNNVEQSDPHVDAGNTGSTDKPKMPVPPHLPPPKPKPKVKMPPLGAGTTPRNVGGVTTVAGTPATSQQDKKEALQTMYAGWA